MYSGVFFFILLSYSTLVSCPIFLFHFRYTVILNEPQREETCLLISAPNEDSDQPVDPRSVIIVFIVRLKKLWTYSYPKCAQRRFWSDCANAKSDLNLRWAHMSKGTFSDVTAHITYPKYSWWTGTCWSDQTAPKGYKDDVSSESTLCAIPSWRFRLPVLIG